MGNPSQRKVEANRENAAKSTGPRSAEGKARSRRNGLKHGLAAEILVRDEDRAGYEATLARWEHEAGPDNVVEEHLIKRAAVGSVILDRLDEAREDSREDSAREAARLWEEKQRHRARRRAQDLAKDPGNIVSDLEATAPGCEWLIRQWRSLDDGLAVGNPWDQRTLGRAQMLLGYPEGIPSIDADPIVRSLWLLAGASSPRAITPLPRLDAEAGYPTDPVAARQMLRAFIADQLERLDTLRDEAWEQADGPSREAAIRQALAADVSRKGQLHHRYARDADRSASSAIRLFLNLRDRRRKEHLAIAREGGRIDIPRVAVGGGWWREVDSAPAPPGYCRVGSKAAVATVGAACSPADLIDGVEHPEHSSEPGPIPIAGIPNPAVEPSRPAPSPPGTGVSPEPTSTPSPIEPAPTDPPADTATSTPDSPQRSEPNSAPPVRALSDRNVNSDLDLKANDPGRASGAPGRTRPLPGPDSTPRTPPDWAPGRPPSDDHRVSPDRRP
jgi:hypothetical protein